MDALMDDLALEFGEHRAHSKHGAPRRRLRVEPLLQVKQADTSYANILDELCQVQDRAPEAINAPGGCLSRL